MAVPGGYLWYQATRDGDNRLSGMVSEATENIGSNKSIAEAEPDNLHNNPERLRRLIESGANVNAEDVNGRTFLCKASSASNIECVKLLLETPGIDINKKSKSFGTALNAAQRFKHTECVKLLQEAGAVK